MAASMKMIVPVLALSLVAQLACGKSKYVTQVLDSKWKATPLLLEASEYIAKESNEKFWAFVDDIARLKSSVIQSDSDKSHYNLIQELAAKHLSPIQLNLLKFSLSLREYSSTVEMYNQIASEVGAPEDCGTFAVIQGEITCDLKKIKSLVKSAGDRPKPAIYKVDHIHPSPTQEVTAILYSELGSAEFQPFHHSLRELAKKGEITYVLRHFVQKPSDAQVRLSGYGVELAIKSTEYKAKDDTKVQDNDSQTREDEEGEDDIQGFVFSKLKEKYPDQKKDLREMRMHLIDTATELTPLKVWQLQDLSVQAAQRVISSPPEDGLKILMDISQNFPKLARSLVREQVTAEMRDEINKNQKYFENHHNLGAGDSAMYLNGLPLDMEVYDIYTLLGIMRSEARVMEGLFSLGLRGDTLNHMLKLDMKTSEESYALDTRHSAVEYINDLESDKKYKQWPRSVQDMLQPTFPGMLRHIAKNFFNLVFVVDLTVSRDLVKLAEAFYVHSAPMRIGLVFVVNTSREITGTMDAGVAFTRAFNYIKIDEKPSRALSFITDVYQKVGANDITADDVMAEFTSRYKDADMDMVFGDTDEYDDVRKASGNFLEQTGLSEFPQVLLNGVPLKKESLNEDGFEEGVVTEVLKTTPTIQRAVHSGELTDSMDILDWLMDRDSVMPRLNSRVLSPSNIYLDFTEIIDAEIYNSPDMFGMMSSVDMAAIMAYNMKYLTKKEEDLPRPVTLWVVTDLETVKGRQLAYAAIKNLKSASDVRLSFVWNPTSTSPEKISINKAVHVALQTLNGNIAKSFITKLVKEEYYEGLISEMKKLEDLEVNGMDMKAYLSSLKKESNNFLKVHRMFVEKALRFAAGARGVIANGRVLGAFGEEEDFIQEDFNLLDKYTFQTSAQKIKGKVLLQGENGNKASDMIMKVGALLCGRRQSETTRKEIHYGGDLHSVLKIIPNVDAPKFEIDAILDPLTRDAQKMAPILQVLKNVADVNIRVFMNCRTKLSEMPLKIFYRYVLEPEVTFNHDGSYTSGPMAQFNDMPQKSLLTLNMNPPESWLVESVLSPYDLDNILLEEVHSGVHAVFELEYLLLEGHCYDSVTGQPPRGLQFVLGTNSTPAVVDTIVMANLGYFQLKAKPGVWFLRLRDGRSAEIYDISNHDFTDTPEGSTDVVVAISSFQSKIIKVRVAKKPDKLKEDLLKDEDEEPTGIWDSISNTITGGTTSSEDKDKTLNIFSLASGHLYERFLRIMMLSVLKHTKSKVKFWFLKTCLSPTFTDFIPYMAEQYGFEFELVQYKWPRWLHQQTEKQRIIWGYKILFLDVLFPLDVKKIIFVDADQIVRTDLQELYDLDLEGAPYGYTPFCDSRKEMDGFRFWKSGYWASHLGHRKYHISALYVVDLKKFRRIAAGDRLRGQYQGLSQDPNSLSNLDQDLPNNMIHQVAIKSLPQEWLYCATWCNDEELAKAKTIDLCNNPLTKEPKLQAAIRIVPEWKNYDYEMKLFWDSIYGTNTAENIEYEKPFDKIPDSATPRTDL